jgi:hypothetical protein
MDGRPTGTPPPDSLRAAWSGHLRDQRRVVLNLRHSTVLQTPKTGQNDTNLGVLFVQMHKMPKVMTRLRLLPPGYNPYRERSALAKSPRNYQ